MLQLYFTLFYNPLFNLLVWLYNVIPGHDIGLAIIALTIIIRLLLFPLYKQSIKSQKALQDLQPKIEELKTKYKDNKEKLSIELMNLYKNEKVNPFSSCLPLLIQMPFLIAVYQVFRSGLNSESLDVLYPFISNPGHINSMFFGYFDLATPNIILALLAGAAQFWQAKMMFSRKPPLIKGQEIKGSGDEKMMAMMNKQMVYFMPILTVYFGMVFPSGLALYWFVNTLLMALQQLLVFKAKQKAAVQADVNQTKIVDLEKKEQLTDQSKEFLKNESDSKLDHQDQSDKAS